MLVCITFWMQTAAARNVSIAADNQNMELVFKSLMSQTGKNFIYSSDLLKGRKCTVKATNRPLNEVLDRIFSGTDIEYTVKGNSILLRRRKKTVPKPAASQQQSANVVISGFVREQSNKEPIVGATVSDSPSGRSTFTNSNGFFSLTIPRGKSEITVSYLGFAPLTLPETDYQKSTSMQLELHEETQLDEVVVTANVNNSKAMDSSEVGSMNLTNAFIKATPVIFGESDVIKTLQLQPGVSAGVEALAGMYVHGGDQDENLYMLDNIPLYQVNHLGGLFSAFNTDAIRSADFYKTSFPAKYDGRLSSFLDVHTKEGSLKEHHGSVTLGLTSGTFNIDGPIRKGRTSYSVAIRRSWLDILTIPTFAIVNSLREKHDGKVNARYAFTDFNAKLNHHFSDRSRGYVMLYYGNDFLKVSHTETGLDNEYEMKESARLSWGNFVASAGWNYSFSPKIFGEITAAYSRYSANLGDTSEDTDYLDGEPINYSKDEYKHDNHIEDWIIRTDFDWRPNSDNTVNFGASYTFHTFLPNKGHRKLITNDYTTEIWDNVPRLHANEVNAYIGDDWRIGRRVRLNAGLHASLFSIQSNTHGMLSPRFSIRITPADNWAVKLAYSRAAQYVHQLTESSISLPTDQWVPVTGSQKPQTADKIAAGVYFSTPDHQFTVSVEGYYKWMRNLLDYVDGYYLLPPSTPFADKLVAGKGKSRGIDFKIAKEYGKITGHISYSLLWADRQFPEINNGEWFPARFDNRHKINIALNWKINSKWEIGTTWTGMSGNRITLPLQCWIDPGIGPWHYDMVLNEKVNNYRLPFYHRLDLAATRKTHNGYWTFSLYNAYCNMNVIAVRRDYSNTMVPLPNGDFDYKPVFQKIRLIPIIPSVSYTWIF